MSVTLRAMTASAAVLLLVGCSPSESTPHSQVAGSDDASVTSTIQVNTEIDYSEGICGDEGAEFEVGLFSADDRSSDPVAEASPRTRSAVQVLHDVPRGEYVLRAAVRTCSGNCAMLDPPSLTCEAPVELRENIITAVDFAAGQECRIRIRPDPRESEVVATGEPVYLPTNDWRPGDAPRKALGGGIVSIDGTGCVTLDGESSAVWPAEYTALSTGGAGATIYDPSGSPVASDGDRIRVGGGSDAGERFLSRCLPRRGEVFSIQSEVEVLNSSNSNEPE